MNLTTLANARQWLGSTTDTDNTLLTRLILAASQQILQYVQRSDFGLNTITETISGRGERKIQLSNWPVSAVNSMTINGVTIPASTGPTGYGYFLEPTYGTLIGRPQNVGIIGGGGPNSIGSNPITGGLTAMMPSYGSYSPRGPFPPGVGNISINYTYGYSVVAEARTIPATPYQITPLGTYGAFGGDNGVSFALGGALTAIASGTPSTGQYVAPTLSGDSPVAFYQFAAADTAKGVLLNYNYVPASVEQACIEIVAERYRYKSRIGQSSSTLGGQETAAYDLSGITKAIKLMLDPYRLVSRV